MAYGCCDCDCKNSVMDPHRGRARGLSAKRIAATLGGEACRGGEGRGGGRRAAQADKGCGLRSAQKTPALEAWCQQQQ
jgi:hypothetical protein